MRIKLDYTKDVNGNAAWYYEQAKEAKKKREGLEKAIEETKKEMEKAKKDQVKQQEAKKSGIKVKREKKWFEKFHWFFTSQGKQIVGGKNAQENDLVVARHMDNADLFFHADIQGASAIILKDGKNATQEEKEEAAQFAACFSNAWKNGNASVDVYAVEKQQLAKHATGGYIPTGAFAIKGERQWFRETKLALKIGKGETGKIDGRAIGDEAIVEILPMKSQRKLKDEVVLVPAQSGKEKGEMAKILAKRYSVNVDELLSILPSGRMKIKN